MNCRIYARNAACYTDYTVDYRLGATIEHMHLHKLTSHKYTYGDFKRIDKRLRCIENNPLLTLTLYKYI